MKKPYFGTLILLFSCFTFFVNAQTFENSKAAEIVRGANLLRIDESRKSISFVRLKTTSSRNRNRNSGSNRRF